MTPINLHHLRLFQAVAQDGTLTGAARRLNISQSAVSTQIKALEGALGHDLFERQGRNIHLTEAGRIALDHAEDIFRTAAHLTATLRATGAGRYPLRIGALATLSRNFQIGFLAPVIGRDDVDLVLRSGAEPDLLRGLDTLELDVVLTNRVPERDAARAYLVRRLADQPVSLVGTPQRRQAPGADLADYLAANPVVLPTPETALRAGFDAMADRLGVQPRVAAEADDMAMLRLLARADLGLAVIPPIVVRDELDSGTLVEFLRIEAVHEDFFAVTTPRRFPNPVLAEVLERYTPPALGGGGGGDGGGGGGGGSAGASASA